MGVDLNYQSLACLQSIAGQILLSVIHDKQALLVDKVRGDLEEMSFPVPIARNDSNNQRSTIIIPFSNVLHNNFLLFTELYIEMVVIPSFWNHERVTWVPRVLLFVALFRTIN